VDKTDKYLMKRRGAIGNAIATRKEEFIHEAETEDSNDKKIDVMEKGKKNKVIIAPTQDKTNALMNHQELEGDLISENGYAKFLNMVNEKMNLATADMGNVVKDFQKSDAPQFKGKSKKKRQEMAIAAKLTAERGGKKLGEEMDCGSDDKKKKGEEEDPRSMKTKDNLVRNKLRAMGLKMSYEPEGEVLEDYVVIDDKGRRQIVKGDPPKAKLKRKPLGHTPEQKRQMNKQPKTDYRARPGESD
jgi:hypothetical protein